MLKLICKRLNESKFARSEDGSLVILTAVSLVFLILVVAVSIDVAEVYRGRVNFQNALDAGTLAAAKVVAATNDKDEALAAGEKVFLANLGNLDPTKGTFSLSLPENGCSGGDIVGQAELDHKIYFDLFNQASSGSDRADHVQYKGSTSVACANDSIEVALVLDNSGSMGGARLSTLKSAATDLVNEIHDSMNGSPLPEPVKFALVPFSSSVNIGGNLRNSSFSETGLDKKGHSPIHHENFNMASNQSFEASGNGWKRKSNGEWVTRFSFYDGLGVSWKGCVETRPYPLNTTDEEPSVSKPETLIVPMFAPDEPDNWHKQYSKKRLPSASKEICKIWKSKFKNNGKLRKNRTCKRWSLGGPISAVLGHYGTIHPQQPTYKPEYNDGIDYANGVYIGAPTIGVGLWVDDKKISEKSYVNSYMWDDVNFPNYAGHPKATPDTGFAGYDVSGGQINRQGWTWKYAPEASGSFPYVTSSYYQSIPRGPNFMCNSQPIQPLTSSKGTVIDAIADMTANGATAISQGAVWGWRALSPGKPFTQGLPKATPQNKKIMIIMSDGNNTYYPGNFMNHSLYGAYGFKSKNRIFDGISSLDGASNTTTNMRIAMDIHLTETCENAKEDGISIYTIAFEVPPNTPVQAMLNGCASPDGAGIKQYYNATDKAALIETFKDIAKKLSELTITG